MPKSPDLNPDLFPAWQHELATAIDNVEQLISRLGLSVQDLPFRSQAEASFKTRVTESYARKITHGDARDPLLLQVLASADENQAIPGYRLDPVDDLEAEKVPGLLHKYPGRVLLITTAACAIHCRYCFRRHYPYARHQLSTQRLQQMMAYIQADTSIHEVILSGGDPLVLSDEKLRDLIAQLETLPHVTQLRLHSRIPVVLPRRITQSLVRVFTKTRLQVTLVIHCNHAQEIGDLEQLALARLHQAGIQIFNQAVLLRGINDDVEVLQVLCETLYRHHAIPYYLHLLDPVAGAAHFDVSEADGVILMEALRDRLPGYMVPRLVRETPGEKSKTPVFGL